MTRVNESGYELLLSDPQILAWLETDLDEDDELQLRSRLVPRH
jgi:hypothetical protein